MAQDMTEEARRSDISGPPLTEASDGFAQLKRRARRRLIGALALALVAAVVLPMVMDHQPPPPMRDVQVRIPSPDEGISQRVSSRSAKEEAPKPIARQETKAESKPEPKAEQKSEPKPEAKAETKAEPKADAKLEKKPEVREPKPESRAEDDKPASAESVAKASGEAWEVQLGAYQEAGRVLRLTNKIKELRLPVYTETVETPNGQRTRVRAGPFPSQEAADKARQRISKIIGVDGPVAKKP